MKLSYGLFILFPIVIFIPKNRHQWSNTFLNSSSCFTNIILSIAKDWHPFFFIGEIRKLHPQFTSLNDLQKQLAQCSNEYLTFLFLFIEGYLHYKTIFCKEVALDVWLMIFFIWTKNHMAFSRYVDFCAFKKSTNFKIFHVIIGIAT